MIHPARYPLLLILLAGIAPTARAADPSALWHIVHDRCVPDEQEQHDPAPCAEVDLTGGYAVLKDLDGNTQFLLIPTARVGGIEDEVVLAPDAPNYLAAAWQARRFVDQRAGHDLPRDDIALAINSVYGRTQDQLHIHIDCIRPDVRAALTQHQAAIGPRWADFPVPLAGHHYRAMRLDQRRTSAPPTRSDCSRQACRRRRWGRIRWCWWARCSRESLASSCWTTGQTSLPATQVRANCCRTIAARWRTDAGRRVAGGAIHSCCPMHRRNRGHRSLGSPWSDPAPTLVGHVRGDENTPFEFGRDLAARIPKSNRRDRTATLTVASFSHGDTGALTWINRGQCRLRHTNSTTPRPSAPVVAHPGGRARVHVSRSARGIDQSWRK